MATATSPKLLAMKALAWADGHRSWRWFKFVLVYVAQAVIVWWAYPRMLPERQSFGQHRLAAALLLLPLIALVGGMLFGATRLLARAIDRRRRAD